MMRYNWILPVLYPTGLLGIRSFPGLVEYDRDEPHDQSHHHCHALTRNKGQGCKEPGHGRLYLRGPGRCRQGKTEHDHDDQPPADQQSIHGSGDGDGNEEKVQARFPGVARARVTKMKNNISQNNRSSPTMALRGRRATVKTTAKTAVIRARAGAPASRVTRLIKIRDRNLTRTSSPCRNEDPGRYPKAVNRAMTRFSPPGVKHRVP